MLALAASLRPHQWTKNVVVFAAVFFSGRGTNVDDILLCAGAFALFCALSSSVYLFNDVADRERDRQHPVKRNRPIASGKVSVGAAVAAGLVLSLGSLAGSYVLGGWNTFAVFASYLVMQVAYSLVLKHKVIVDVLCIAAGFLLRVFAGVMVLGAVISPWIVACSVQLALFLALCKRRAEAAGLDENAEAGTQRPALRDYAGPATDMMIGVMATATPVTYALYTIIPNALIYYLPAREQRPTVRFGARGMIWTLPFVLYGVLRYLYLVYHREKGERPEEVLFTDRPLLLAIVLYAVVAGWAVYTAGPAG